jgi:sugar phosphate isomerase/epimerase
MEETQVLEPGVMFWARNSAKDTLDEVKSFGVNGGHLGIPGEYALAGKDTEWLRALEGDEFQIGGIFCSYEGEDYASFATVIDTVGFVPPKTRAERVQRTKEVADFASKLGVRSVACHVGFIPEDHQNPIYGEMVKVVRDVCNHCHQHRQYFTMETGQEPPKVLLQFIADVDRKNLRVNFDPANMIMYGTGDPIEALEVLREYVVSVHCKDGDWPLRDKPELLGVERPLGEGSVGIDNFVAKLKEIGYTGLLTVEREGVEGEQRRRDIQRGVDLIKSLIQQKGRQS